MSLIGRDSPVKRFRVDEFHMTQAEFAHACGVSKLLIIRAEQCCYKLPPPAIENYLVSQVPAFDLNEFRADYLNFQRKMRKFSYGILEPGFDFHHLSPKKHPFIEWREYSAINQTMACKYWCLHPAVIYKFEVQPHLLNDLPSDLVDALLESGYSELIIAELRAAYKRYKTYLASKVGVRVEG